MLDCFVTELAKEELELIMKVKYWIVSHLHNVSHNFFLM